MDSGGMKFPVDLLADTGLTEMEKLSHNYLKNLFFSNPDCPERLTLSGSTEVIINISSVGFVPLYGSSDKKILALFSPTDWTTPVALYLLDKWWAVEDILRTADPARDGAVEVETVGERIVLYILNRVIYRAQEMSSEELPFLCHGENHYAKILWNNGEAIGFYSVKHSGSPCNSCPSRIFQLPVMDSIFVRKCHRGKGFGLQMLEDFVISFEEDSLGLRYPLSKSMYKVCEKYLSQYPGDAERLWEVESIGRPNQRTNIANKIQTMNLSEAELPVTARGQRSGSLRRKMGKGITGDKSEKMIRIKDIEAEEHQIAEMPDTSELLQSEDLFSAGPEGSGDNAVDPTHIVETATTLDKPVTDLASQDNFDIILALATEEPELEDDAAQDPNNTCHDSQITAENKISEFERAKEDPQKEDSAVLVISGDIFAVHAVDTLSEMGEGLVGNTSIKKCKCIPHSQEVDEEIETEDDEKKEVCSVEVVEDLAVTGAGNPGETEATKVDEVAMEEQVTKEEIGVEDADTREVVLAEKNVVEKVTDESETKQTDEEIPTTNHQSDDEIESPPVVKRRYLKRKCKVTPKPESKRLSKRHYKREKKHTDEDSVAPGGSGDENAMDENMEKRYQMKKSKLVDKTEKETLAVELTDVDDCRILEAEEGAEVVKPSTDASLAKHKEDQEDEKTETISVMDTEEKEAGDVIKDSEAFAATSVIPDVLDEAVFLSAKDSQKKDIDCEIPKLPQATVILVDLKTTSHHQSVKVAEETPSEGEWFASQKEEVEMIIPDEVSSCFAGDQTLESEMPSATEEGTVDKEEFEEGNDNKGMEKSASVDGEECGVEEEFIETGILKIGLKMVKASHQEREEDNIGGIISEKVYEAETGPVEGSVEMEAMTNDAVMTPVPVEEKQSQAIAQTIPNIERHIPTVEDAEEAISESEVGEEEVEVTIRSLRSGTKTASPRHKTRRQIGEKEAQYSKEEEVMTTRTLMQEDKQSEISIIVKETGEKEEAVKGDNVEKTDEERKGHTEVIGEKAEEKATPEIPENAEPEVDVQIGKTVAEELQDVAEQPEAIFTTFAAREPESSGKQCDERKKGMLGKAEQQTPVSVTGSLRSGRKTPRPLATSRSTRSKKQQDEEEGGGGAPAEKSTTEDQEPRNIKMGKNEEDGTAEPGSAEEPPTEIDEEKALQEERMEVEEKHVTLEEEDNMNCWTAAGEDLIQSSKDGSNSATNVSKVSVVLVDLNETQCKVQNETASVEECLPAETSAIKMEEEQRTETMKEGEEHALGTPVGIEKTELEKVVVREKTFGEQVEETGIVQGTREVIAMVIEKDNKAESVNDKEEVKVTSQLRSTIHEVKDTQRGKSKKSRQKKVEEKKEELQEEEKQQQILDLEKGGTSEVMKATQSTENVEQQMGLVQVDLRAEDAFIPSENGQASSNETVSGENIEVQVGQTALERKPSDGIAKEAVIAQTTNSVSEMAQVDEAKGISGVEEAPITQTRALSSGENIVTAKSKTTKTDEQDAEVTGGEHFEDKPAVETRVLRKGRRSAATPRRKAKRAHTQRETEEERKDQTSPAEDIEFEDGEAQDKEDCDEKTEEKIGEDPVIQKGENTATQAEMKTVGAAGEEFLIEEETVEKELFAVSETCAIKLKETSARGNGNEVPNTDDGGVSDVEKAPVIVTSNFAGHGKAVKSISTTQTPKYPQEEIEEAGMVVEESLDRDESAVEIRVLRKGRRYDPARPRNKAKRACIQHETEEREKKIAEGVEEKIVQGPLEEKGEDINTEINSMAVGIKIDTHIDKAAEIKTKGEPSVGDTDQMKGDLTVETAELEKEDVVDAESDVIKIHETNSADAKETIVTDKATAAAALDMISHTAIAEPEPLFTDQSVLTENNAPTAASQSLGSKTKTSQATPPRRSRRQKDQGVGGTQQVKETLEQAQDGEQFADDTPEFVELCPFEEGGVEEASSDGNEGGDLAKDSAEDLYKVRADLRDDRSKQLELSNTEDNLENERGAFNNEKENDLNLVLNTDDEADTAGLGQKDEEGGQNMLEYIVEPIVIGKKVLRGRTVPAQIVTPRSQSRHRTPKVQKSEDFLPDEGMSPQLVYKTSLRKRKQPEVTPVCKSRRCSRVKHVLSTD